MKAEKLIDHLIVEPGRKISLGEDFDPAWVPKGLTEEAAREGLQADVQDLARQQEMLYAQDSYALLVIVQAMDAAGKDGTIKHVMSGINPQGCEVHSFKGPSAEELDHDYLWRCNRALPERGRIGIFNRSYYEEVLVVRVHPEFLQAQKLPPESRPGGIWKRRFTEINNFESYLVDNGIRVVKFFLNVSKAEQRRRFLDRIDRPAKNWKFSAADVAERRLWSRYMKAYEDLLRHTSTPWAPWYVIPADHKWFAHLAVGSVLLATMKELRLSFPKVDPAHRRELLRARSMLRGS